MRRSSTAIRHSASSMVSERGYSGAVQLAATAGGAGRRRRRTKVVAKPAASGVETAPRPASAQSRSGKTVPSGQVAPRVRAERSHRLPSYKSSTVARKYQSRIEFLPADAGSTDFSRGSLSVRTDSDPRREPCETFLPPNGAKQPPSVDVRRGAGRQQRIPPRRTGQLQRGRCDTEEGRAPRM